MGLGKKPLHELDHETPVALPKNAARDLDQTVNAAMPNRRISPGGFARQTFVCL
jgi:hypothetical protein